MRVVAVLLGLNAVVLTCCVAVLLLVHVGLPLAQHGAGLPVLVMAWLTGTAASSAIGLAAWGGWLAIVTWSFRGPGFVRWAGQDSRPLKDWLASSWRGASSGADLGYGVRVFGLEVALAGPLPRA